MDLDTLLRKMGIRLNPWTIQRWQRRWDGFTGSASDRRKTTGYRHKFCPECGGLVAREDAKCSRCGAAVGKWTGHVARRTLGMFFPEGRWFCSLTIATCILLALAGMLGTDQHISRALTYAGGLFSGYPDMPFHAWRFVSYGFLHGGLMHLAFNMFALYQLGLLLENQWGSRRFMIVYLVCLLGGGAARFWLGGVAVSVGASGAVAGLIGAGITYGLATGRHDLHRMLMQWVTSMIIFSVVMEVMHRASGGVRIDHLAHIGGFVAGLGCGHLVALVERIEARTRSPLPRRIENVFALLSGLALLAGLLTGLYGMMRLLPTF